jgi:hypothetical protein
MLKAVEKTDVPDRPQIGYKIVLERNRTLSGQGESVIKGAVKMFCQ